MLITGGRRVGGELAVLLASRGANVAMTFHTSRATIERTITEVEAFGVAGLAVGADLSRSAEAENAVRVVSPLRAARCARQYGEACFAGRRWPICARAISTT